MGKINIYSILKDKIKYKKAVITVIGLGYVGLPIALEFASKGFKVNGLDNSKERIEALKGGKSYINDITDSTVKKAISKNNFSVTTDNKVLRKTDVIIICVPTPLRKIDEPDISFVVNVSQTISKNLNSNQLIILESTTYPGTTREVILPILEEKGYKMGEDFYLAFSPERIDPGNPKYDFTNIPKVIGGFTKKGTELGRLLYSHVVKKTVGVSTPEAAEVTKLLENTFRIVNIGLINEFAYLCHKLDIDVWEVIEAAKTKPFGFMPFYPGPGIGGHCIPADPIYLSWKARKVGFQTHMIDLAAKVNRAVPSQIVTRTEVILKKHGKEISGAKILIVGAAYKRDVNDLRESPALDVWEVLTQNKAEVCYHDPLIPKINFTGIKAVSKKITKALLGKQDLVLLITDHSSLDYRFIAKNSKIIFDTRNVFEKNGIVEENIVRL